MASVRVSNTSPLCSSLRPANLLAASAGVRRQAHAQKLLSALTGVGSSSLSRARGGPRRVSNRSFSALAIGTCGGVLLSARRREERNLAKRERASLPKSEESAEVVVLENEESEQWPEQPRSPSFDTEPSVWPSIALVAGATIGAGVLALPAVTAPAGFVPASIALLVCWVYTATTGLLLAEVAVDTMAKSGRSMVSTQSMAEETIGTIGASLSSFLYFLLHVAIMTAYVSRGGDLLEDVLPSLAAFPASPAAVFAGLCGGFVFLTKGTALLDLANGAMLALIIVSFLALVGLLSPMAVPSRLTDFADWGKVTATVPTLLLSLVYHQVVPSVCQQLNGDRSKITTAIVGGSFVPCLLFLSWNAAFLAATAPGLDQIPVDPLENLRATGGPLVSKEVTLFSLLAIITSLIGCIVAISDFMHDILRKFSVVDAAESETRLRDFVLTLTPPVLIAAGDPTLFFQALDKAGAFGDSLLFGLLPALMAYRARAAKDSAAPQDAASASSKGSPSKVFVPFGSPFLVLVAVGAVAVVVDNTRALLA
eukprot:TRINITY_DN74439_c0_g1_i1.p1 TRINITY_DN74439_c0_g1~~TRINITY_DN74439_c0_g1_i1.p1  ORF type:complete len:539 (-),score=37.71 TRINITY_DN74439_c0_g1_i1:285-1901(-)